MKTLFVPLMGRFGNQLFIYCHARVLAERDGLELCVGDWVGDQIFDIPKSRRVLRPDIELQADYFQNQQSLIYTRAQVRQWLQIRPSILAQMPNSPPDELLAHHRFGDYLGTGFPVVSKQSYLVAMTEFGFDMSKALWITEEKPTNVPNFNSIHLEFLADFIRLMNCKVLFRGNSTFSWWAATLGNARVFSPVIDGLPGGCIVENVRFVEGNHPKMVNLDFVSDLYLKES